MLSDRRVSISALVLLVVALTGLVTAQGSSCPPGYVGPNCGLCTTDQQCVEETGNSSATCSNSFDFANTTTVKSYQCNPQTPSLVTGLLKPDSVVVQCFTGLNPPSGPGGAPAPEAAPPVTEQNGPPQVAVVAQSPSAPASSSNTTGLFGRRLQQSGTNQTSDMYCTVAFDVRDPSVGVNCLATTCSASPGNPDVICESIACTCSDNGTCANDILVTNIVKSASGRATWTCDANGTCTLGIKQFIVPEIGVKCNTSECLLPSSTHLPGNNGTNSTSGDQAVKNLNINPLIAAIPTIALSIVIGFVGQYAWKNQHYWEKGVIIQTDGLHLKSNTSKHVESLEFKNLGVFVPISERVAERKKAALRGKALVRHATMHTLSQKHSYQHTVLNKLKRFFHVRTSEDLELDSTMVRMNNGRTETNSAEAVVALHNGRKHGEWCVLNECSGTISPGEVVGVLGPSGCGKTTLLSAITGSAFDLGNKATISGDVMVNGEPRKTHHVAYVPQADNLIPTLTVRECVKYSALLRLPRDTSSEEINNRVELVLSELGLQHVGDSQVGGSGKIRGISGGERRRVTIAMELVIDPSIIVLDEPTSGLDSYTAMSLTRSLRQVVQGGRIVMASLHQPSKDMFYALDRVILMGHGRIIYMGRPEEAELFLEQAGYPTPEGGSVAEHLLEVASNPESIIAMLRLRQNRDSQGCSQKNKGVGSPSKIKLLDDQKISRPETPSDIDSALTGPSPQDSPKTDELDVIPAKRPGITRQLSVMFWRTYVDIIRNPTLMTLHVSLALFTGIIAGAIFYQLADNSIGVQNRMGGTFFALAFLAFTSLTTVDLLMNERAVVMREVRSRFYNPSSYLISKLALDGMLLRVIPAILYWIPFYYMAGFNSGAAHAASYLFILIAFNCAVGALSMAVTIISSTAGQSSFVMNFILLFSLAFTGFLVNVNSIPAVLRWIHYLSVFFYAFEAMLTTELNGQTYTFLYQSSPTAQALEIPNISGETFLASLGFNTESTTRDIGILVGIYFGFVVLCLIFFHVRLPRTRHQSQPVSVSKAIEWIESKVEAMKKRFSS